MKLTVIGGGGVRSMFLAKSISQQAEALQITELVFMDIDAEKLRIFGGMAKHVAEMICPSLRFSLTADPVEAVRNADYIITTIRVGGDAARVRDEHICLDRGLLGQETTGAAGFAFAMRSVPALIGYCELVRKYARPGAKIFNFTNPVGIVSQALRDAGYDFTYGICDAPSGMLQQFAKLYGANPAQVYGEMFGLNHLSWFHTVEIDGKNAVPEILRSEEARAHTDMRFFTPEMLAYAGSVPNEYLYYYYCPEKAIGNILKTGHTRGDDILEINLGMLEELRPLDPEKDFDACLKIYSKWYGMRENRYMATETGIRRDYEWTFDIFSPDAGGYAGVALRFIQIAQSGKKDRMVLCLPNQGAADFLEATDTVEVTCDIVGGEAYPHRFEKIPSSQAELIRRVKYYERRGAQAILSRDKAAAIDCLTMHPLVNSFTLAAELVDVFLAASPEYAEGWE